MACPPLPLFRPHATLLIPQICHWVIRSIRSAAYFAAGIRCQPATRHPAGRRVHAGPLTTSFILSKSALRALSALRDLRGLRGLRGEKDKLHPLYTPSPIPRLTLYNPLNPFPQSVVSQPLATPQARRMGSSEPILLLPSRMYIQLFPASHPLYFLPNRPSPTHFAISRSLHRHSISSYHNLKEAPKQAPKTAQNLDFHINVS